MAVTNSLSLYLLAGMFLAYTLYTRIALHRRRQRMIAEHGCKPCPHRYNTDNIIGLNVLLETARNTRLRRLLPGNRARFLKQKTHTFLTRMIHYPFVATAEPENIKTILSLRFKDYGFGNRSASFTPLLGPGIFNNDGEKWANSRHLIRPNFAREQVANLEDFERHFKLLLRHIPSDGETFDIQPLFFKFTIDSATEFLYNHSTNSLRMTEEDEETSPDAIFARAFTFAQEDVLARLRWDILDVFRPKSKAKEAIRICHAYVDKIVDQAIQWRRDREAAAAAGKKVDDDGRYVFIHELVKQTDDKEQVRSELMNVLLAGRDTTASLMSNALFEISQRPHIWAKIREEIAFLKGREPTYEELKSFKYLKYCLNECKHHPDNPLNSISPNQQKLTSATSTALRLNPVVPMNARMAIRDTVLPLGGGPDCKSPLFIPKGWQVGYSPYTLHRRADIYGPDAEEFRPERWETLRVGWEYLPFNGGPRICLGQQYALAEAGYVICRLAQTFARLESRDETGEWVEALTLTCCSGNGVKIGVFGA